jgi:hypothetical protein
MNLVTSFLFPDARRSASCLNGESAYLGLGYLHADKLGRYSLVYDAIEVLRPRIDEKVFAFVDGAIFRMGDFQVTPSGPYRGEVRVSPELLKAFGPATCLPAQVIEEAAEWLVDEILGPSRTQQEKNMICSTFYNARGAVCPIG